MKRQAKIMERKHSSSNIVWARSSSLLGISVTWVNISSFCLSWLLSLLTKRALIHCFYADDAHIYNSNPKLLWIPEGCTQLPFSSQILQRHLKFNFSITANRIFKPDSLWICPSSVDYITIYLTMQNRNWRMTFISLIFHFIPLSRPMIFTT